MSDVFLVLADPTRRRLVELLRDGARSVGELVARVNIAQPGVSRHLRILEENGFVSVRADQQRRIYSLRDEPFRELEDWVREHRDALSERLDRLGKVVEKKRR